jgi:hypothetical protein
VHKGQCLQSISTHCRFLSRNVGRGRCAREGPQKRAVVHGSSEARSVSRDARPPGAAVHLPVGSCSDPRKTNAACLAGAKPFSTASCVPHQGDHAGLWPRRGAISRLERPAEVGCRSERCIGYLGSDGAEQRRFLSCAGSASRSESGRSKSRKRWVTRRSSATRGQLARNGRTVDVELVVIESPGRGDPRLRCSHEESRCVTDATGALEKQEPVGHCAHHDELTGLPDCLFLAGTPAECN